MVIVMQHEQWALRQSRRMRPAILCNSFSRGLLSPILTAAPVLEGPASLCNSFQHGLPSPILMWDFHTALPLLASPVQVTDAVQMVKEMRPDLKVGPHFQPHARLNGRLAVLQCVLWAAIWQHPLEAVWAPSSWADRHPPITSE